MTLEDFDGDNDLDAWVLDLGSSRVLINNGVGVFTISQTLNTGGGVGGGMDFGDVNSNGSPDVFIAKSRQTNEVWLNDPNSSTGATCNGLTVTVDINSGQTPTTGDDVILGTSGADVVAALEGNDTICAAGGDDVINGGPGDDIVNGGSGDDPSLVKVAMIY